jgi:competence transcription factor ComK
MMVHVRETLSHHYTTTYQISLTYLKRQKVIAQTQTHLKNINYLTLKSKVKLRSRWNTTHRLMIIHGTLKYQISLIYRKRQKCYDSDTITLKKYQLFDLKVKGQRQNVVMLVHDYTPTYQIALTYLKRQKSYGPTVNLQIHSN